MTIEASEEELSVAATLSSLKDDEESFIGAIVHYKPLGISGEFSATFPNLSSIVGRTPLMRLVLTRTAKHRKKRARISDWNEIRTYDRSVRTVKAQTLDHAATENRTNNIFLENL